MDTCDKFENSACRLVSAHVEEDERRKELTNNRVENRHKWKRYSWIWNVGAEKLKKTRKLLFPRQRKLCKDCAAIASEFVCYGCADHYCLNVLRLKGVKNELVGYYQEGVIATEMAEIWNNFESDDTLVQSVADSIENWDDLIESLEGIKLIRAGDCVDLAANVGGVSRLRSLLRSFSLKNEETFKRFKRTLIENGEYNAVEVLCANLCDNSTEVSQTEDIKENLDFNSNLDSDLHKMTISSPSTPPPPIPQSNLGVRRKRAALAYPPAMAGPSRDPFTLETPASPATSEIDARELPSLEARSGDNSELNLVTVKKSTRWCEAAKAYDMVTSPRGLCVIFNIMHFTGMSHKDRPGSQQDCDRMKSLFTELDFLVMVHTDVTADVMISLIDTYSNEEVNRYSDAFVCIIMSHGAENHVYGSDDCAVKLSNIFEKFNNANCPALKERPKLFFIQACRGNGIDNGTFARDVVPYAQPVYPHREDDHRYSTETDALPSSQTQTHSTPRSTLRLSSWSDVYIAYSVIEGYESMRDTDHGSWFLKAVYDEFAHNAHDTDFDTMMENVADVVLSRARYDGQRQCPEMKKIGFTRKLFFNPGLSSRTCRELMELRSSGSESIV